MGARQSTQATTFSSKSCEWFTPDWLLDAAREFLGGFDLDPASCAEANEHVKAAQYYTIADDGLALPWFGRVWCNPPYGSRGGVSVQGLWAQRMHDQYYSGNMRCGFLLVRSALGYNWYERFWREHSVCMLRDLVKFVPGDGQPTSGGAKQAASLFYFGRDGLEFERAWQDYGRVLFPEPPF